MYSLSDIVTSANETKVINPHQFYDDVFERRVFNGTFIIQTFYSGHYHFMNEKGLKALKESGLINDGETWSHARNRLTRWLIRPNKRIMNLVSPYRKKPGTIQLGVQIRTGGKLANTHEPTVFLNDSSMPFIISTINSQLINRPSITELYISSDSVFMAIRIMHDVNATLCNPYRSLHFVHKPLAGYANSFRALRGLIALALMINASVTSKYNSHISFVATWKPFCSLLDESLSCICRSGAIIGSNVIPKNNASFFANTGKFYNDAIERKVAKGIYYIQACYSGHSHFMSEKGLKALKESGLINDGETWSHARNR